MKNRGNKNEIDKKEKKRGDTNKIGKKEVNR